MTTRVSQILPQTQSGPLAVPGSAQPKKYSSNPPANSTTEKVTAVLPQLNTSYDITAIPGGLKGETTSFGTALGMSEVELGEGTVLYEIGAKPAAVASILGAFFSWIRNSQQEALANKLGDKSAAYLARLGKFEAGIEGTIGATIGVDLLLDMTAEFANINMDSLSHIQGTTQGLGVAINVLSAIYLIAQYKKANAELDELESFKFAFETAPDPIAFLKEKLNEKTGDPNELAVKILSHYFEQWAKQTGVQLEEGKTWEKVVEQLFSQEDRNQIGVSFNRQRNEAKLTRFVGAEIVAAAGKETAVDEQEAVSLFKTAVKTLDAQIRTSTITRNIVILGVIGVVAGFILTGGIGAIIAASIGLLLVLITIAQQVQAARNDIKHGVPPSDRDLNVLKFHLGCAVAAIAIGVVLGALGIATFGLAPLIIGAISGLVWVLFDSYMLKTLGDKQEKFLQENPTLEYLEEKFRDPDVSMETIIKLAQKLNLVDSEGNSFKLENFHNIPTAVTATRNERTKTVRKLSDDLKTLSSTTKADEIAKTLLLQTGFTSKPKVA